MKYFDIASDTQSTPRSLHWPSETHPIDPLLTYRYQVRCHVKDLLLDPSESSTSVWTSAPLTPYDRIRLPGHKPWYQRGDTVLIRAIEGADHEVEYLAVILEIRALDPQNCSLRIAWFNRAADLPPRLQDPEAYGADEVFPTAFMDIVDAKNIIKKISLVRLGDDQSRALRGGYRHAYWRASFDVPTQQFVGTGFGERERCVCGRPANPQARVQCDSAACKRVMHPRCLAEHAHAEGARSQSSQRGAAKSRRRSAARAEYDFEIETRDEDEADELGLKPLHVRLTDRRLDHAGQTRSVQVSCLHCGAASIKDRPASPADDAAAASREEEEDDDEEAESESGQSTSGAGPDSQLVVLDDTASDTEMT